MFSLQLIIFVSFFMISRVTNLDFTQEQIIEARQLFPFRAYKDVQILHYVIPSQVTFAMFQYKANGSFHCSAKTVAVYLQYGSYPVMNVHNSSYPDHFAVRRMHLHNVTLTSNFVPVTINITNPLPGSWYAAAFLVENTEKIAQKGLFTPCLSWLSSSLKFNVAFNVINILHQAESIQKISGLQLYRFFGLKNDWTSEISLKNCKPHEVGKCPAIIRVRQFAIPSVTNSDSSSVNCIFSDMCVLKMIPAIDNWNYISIQSLVPDLEFTLTVRTEDCEMKSSSEGVSDDNDVSITYNESLRSDLFLVNNSSENSFCWTNIPLVRISLPTNLAFEYNLPADEEDSYPFMFNITNEKDIFTSFEVLPTVDIGGTLVVELAVSPFTNITENNVSVLACLSYGIRATTEDTGCSNGSPLSVNTSTWPNRFSSVFVPYPEAGLWYLHLRAVCYDFNESLSSVPCEALKTVVFLRIRSTPCVLGHCGVYGTCYQYVSGGLIFSTCNCIAGWKGWGCTDNSTARSDMELLMNVLLLTLSNLLFIPAIILSVHRKYFSEAFVYFATMVSSAFYHACDAEVYSYCLLKLSMLQFCDFYSAILSVWVTLIAMAKLPNTVQSFVHMTGAFGVALGVEYDRTGLWVFVIPAGIGLTILLVSWVTRCYKKRLCYPTRKIWIFSLLPGFMLAISGLIIYAFFETKDNYPFVHSAWHATIALSVLFLLPETKPCSQSTPEPASSCSYIRVGDVSCPDVSQPVGTAYTHLLAPTP